ncbi:MAG: BON domain-containing protein [Acidobacteria bacterium]|nr:BON domain-containing protein [Acidobacteriota bacterium]
MKLNVIAAVGMLLTVPGGAFAQSPPATQTRPGDQELSNLIAKAISNDPTLSADAIKVSVNGGVVTLSGMVGKDADRARAEQLARVPGVSRVENNLKSREKATAAVKGTANTVADASKKGAKATKNAVSKTGEVITDEWIVTRIRTNVANDEALSGSDIKVDSKNNVVTLSGTVPTAAARAKALAVAKDVEGVSRVVNNLKVAAKTGR